jgi:hypothetical protein
MLKAAQGLQMLYLRMVCLKCLAHGLHVVAGDILGKYPEVDRLISNIKKIFLKAALRVEKCMQEWTSLLLSPPPVLTRW